MKVRCPKDVNRHEFERMMNAVPEGFRFTKSRVPVSPYVPSFWRDFHFIAERKPKERGHLKQGDELVLACVRKLRK